MDTVLPLDLQVKRLGSLDGMQSCVSLVDSDGPTNLTLVKGMPLLQNGTGLIASSGQDSREPVPCVLALAYMGGSSQKGAKWVGSSTTHRKPRLGR